MPRRWRAISRTPSPQHTGPRADPAHPQWLFHYLGATHATHGLSERYFADEAERGCILLVDAFDEVSEELEREGIGKLLKNLSLDPRFEATKIVGTSRPGQYGGLTSIPGFETARIAPLGEEEREIFVANWGQALYPDAPEEAKAFSTRLSHEIGRPQVGILAKNPMMMTALAVLHFVEGRRLPEQRSELYRQILGWLARSGATRRHDGTTSQDFLLRMRRLAIRMSAGEEEMRAEMEMKDAINELEKDFRRQGGPEERRAAAKRFLQEEEIKSGVIIQNGSKLRFWHLTFREALTAQGLAEDGRWRVPLLEKGKLYDGLWRETVLLLAGELKSQGGDQKADELLEEMLNRAGPPDVELTEKARCVGLMGLLLKDLEAWNYVMADEMAARHKALRDEVIKHIFDKEKAYEIPFAVRLDAANALGLTGDPRLEQDNFVRVEGGNITPFFIGRYPVTVAEFQHFVEARGYSIEEYWKAGGFGEFTEPDDWAAQLDEPKNRPVTGVSWYEASAYCAWNKGRLPKEKEWESAARANREGVEYPWGNDEPNERLANYDYQDSPGKPTPVGLYPAGATPTGLHDMAGNVWEWVEDAYEGDEDRRVLRGGGWSYVAWGLRVSYRSRGSRAGRGGNVGFRCVREVVSL